ncbi:MAG TPA: tetratricopeptide repeat protein, partial [Gemmatimonadales bacterium]|nr:tetratricopeptide repeat protein [Gemmatimonadales bacterium]
GKRLNDLGMYTLIDLPVARTMRAMTSLTSQRILRDAGSHLEFANAAIRNDCYQAMAAPLRRQLHSLVSDRLLVEFGKGEPIPGLELAWHLVRADRLKEGVPYLLDGGRESIRRGAPHEVDLALRTGIPALEGTSRQTAILLHAEALQDLGQWAESLEVLDMPAGQYGESDEAWRRVLKVVGRRWVGDMSASDIDKSTDDLLAIADASLPVEIRAKAMAATVRMLTLSRDRGAIGRLQTSLGRLPPAISDPYDRLHVILAAAWIRTLNNEYSQALALLTDAVSIAAKDGYRSSLVARILIGQGNVMSLLGDYESALQPLEHAIALAKNLDNPTLLAECSVQLATAFGRLGRRKEQIHWASIACDRFHPDDWSPGAVGAQYELGIGMALDARAKEAKQVAESLARQALSERPGWSKQAALLCAADILALAGRPKHAMRIGAAGIAVDNEKLLDDSYAGQFSRWIALGSGATGMTLEALAILDRELPSDDILHAKDRIEVRAARAYLRGKGGGVTTQEWDQINQSLVQLPPGVSSILKGAGLLRADRLNGR